MVALPPERIHPRVHTTCSASEPSSCILSQHVIRTIKVHHSDMLVPSSDVNCSRGKAAIKAERSLKSTARSTGSGIPS
jgi:hypothetical protein